MVPKESLSRRPMDVMSHEGQGKSAILTMLLYLTLIILTIFIALRYSSINCFGMLLAVQLLEKYFLLRSFRNTVAYFRLKIFWKTTHFKSFFIHFA